MYNLVKSQIGVGFLGIGYLEGGAFERPGFLGTSHLMEHLMCKTFNDQLSVLTRLGITYNAYTDEGRVVFWFSGYEDSLKKVAQLLVDRIIKQPVLWTEEEFLQEKKTVLEEYQDYFNNQQSAFSLNAYRKYYNYAGAIGYRKDIEHFNYQKSLELAKQYQTPYQIVEVGMESNIDTEGILFNSGRNFVTDVSFNPNYKDLAIEDYPRDSRVGVSMISTTPFYYDAHANFDMYSKLLFILKCVTGGIESPLYQEIREKRGLAYTSGSDIMVMGNKLVPQFEAFTGPDRHTELKDVYSEFFNRAPEEVITQSRFNDVLENRVIKQKMSSLLPHSGYGPLLLTQVDPFANIEDFKYEDILNLYAKVAKSLYQFTDYSH